MARRAAQDRKCFGQACTVAKALDIIGDRWTLLIARELLGGPARFSELLEGLPGVARNLLSGRLRQLERDAVVRRVEVQGATLYALTEHGARLRPLIDQLGYWGAKVKPVGPIVHARSLRSIAVAMQAILSRAGGELPEQPEALELELELGPLEIVMGPQLAVTARPSSAPVARVASSAEAVTDFLEGRGLDRRRFRLTSGDGASRKRLLALMGAMA